jgi:sugar phosphate isomerase/epimerase
MRFSRRQLLAGTAAGLARAAAQSRSGGSAKAHAAPTLCLYSRVLVNLDYNDLPMLLKGLGFDGCDLSVEPGGHVLPQQSPTDLMPALEAMTGGGLDVPLMTTAYTSMADPTIQNVLGLAGLVEVPLFRTGYWKLAAAEVDARLGEVQQALLRMASLGRQAGMATAVPNFTGDHGGLAVADISRIIRGIDPQWVGIDFDIGYATAEGGAGGWAAALQMALPRLKAVTARDFRWSEEGKRMVPCALGEGVVEWPQFFALLGRSRFVGPISLHLEYETKDRLAAIRHDLAFLKKQVGAAYRT